MTKISKYKIEFLVAIMVLSSSLIASQVSAQAVPPKLNENLQKITVAYTLQPQGALVHIAAEKGFFLAEGIELESSMHSFGKQALEAVMEGKADFATVAETPFMFSILNGKKNLIVANIVSTNTNSAIVARKSAGIIKPTDLKGKRVGNTPGTTGDFFLDSYLTSHGLRREQVIIVEVKPDEVANAFANKKIDAVSTWNYPLTLVKELLGPDGIVFYDKEIYTETFNVAATEEYVRKNPENVKRLLRGLIKAEKFLISNPEEAMTIMARRTKQDIKLIRTVWPEFKFRVILDKTILITLEDESRWAIKNKLTTEIKVPEFRKHLYLDGLEAVRPESVKMKR